MIANSTAIGAAADQLTAAQLDGVPCAAVRLGVPAGDIDAANAVRSVVIGARPCAGARRVGRKIGLAKVPA